MCQSWLWSSQATYQTSIQFVLLGKSPVCLAKHSNPAPTSKHANSTAPKPPKHTHKQQRSKHTNKQASKHTNKQASRQTTKQAGKQSIKQTIKQTNTHKQANTQTYFRNRSGRLWCSVDHCYQCQAHQFWLKILSQNWLVVFHVLKNMFDFRLLVLNGIYHHRKFIKHRIQGAKRLMEVPLMFFRDPQKNAQEPLEVVSQEPRIQ